jgi:hypothetical protein
MKDWHNSGGGKGSRAVHGFVHGLRKEMVIFVALKKRE